MNSDYSDFAKQTISAIEKNLEKSVADERLMRSLQNAPRKHKQEDLAPAEKPPWFGSVRGQNRY